MDTPTKILLLRHGEVEVRYHRVFGGRIDMELSPKGHEQAKAAANFLRQRHIDAIYASPMKRAQQTLAPVSAHKPVPPVVLQDLREVDFGHWTGLTWEQVFEQFKVSAFDWLDHLDEAAIPGAESAQQFRQRLDPCLRQITSHAGQSVLVVCHGGVIRMLLAMLLDIPIRKLARFNIEYASLTEVHYTPQKADVELLNFAPWRDLA